MALLSKGNIFAIVEEVTFNTAPAFVDTDTQEVTSDTNLAPNVDSIERKVILDSFVGQPSVAIKETGSGTMAYELIPDNTGTDLPFGLILKAAMGRYEAAGADTGAFIGFSDAGTTPAEMIFKAEAADTGTSDLWTLSRPADTKFSLAIQQFVGGSGDDVITYAGVVPASTTFNFPVADICSAVFEVGASSFVTSTGETPLVSTALTSAPYVGKNATFVVGGTPYCAKDVSVTIPNTIVDYDGLCSTGIMDKIITGKAVTGSFKMTFEDFSELDKLKNNTDGTLYLRLGNGSNEFAIYLPKIRYSAVNIADADGLIENTVEFAAYPDDTSGEVILVANT